MTEANPDGGEMNKDDGDGDGDGRCQLQNMLRGPRPINSVNIIGKLNISIAWWVWIHHRKDQLLQHQL